MFKYQQLPIFLTVIISTMFSRALQWEWCGAWSALWIQVILERVTINCIFFAMALREDTYKLLIVSYELASGHDLVTVPDYQCASVTQSTDPPPKAATLSGQLTQTWLAGWSLLQQTAYDNLGTWQGHWDSPFHVGLHTWYTKQVINLTLKLLSHVVRQFQSGAWNVAGTSSRTCWAGTCWAGKHNMVLDVCNTYSTWCQNMKSVYLISYKISLISVKNRPYLLTCRYCVWYCTQYWIKTFDIGCWQVAKTVKIENGPQYNGNIEYIILPYWRKP